MAISTTDVSSAQIKSKYLEDQIPQDVEGLRTNIQNGLKSNTIIGYTKNNRAQREEMHMNKTTQKLNYIR